MVCGVVWYWYWNKNFGQLCLCYLFLIVALKDCTALSVSPFEAGWYGAVRTYLVPLLLINSLNSSATKQRPFFQQPMSGKNIAEFLQCTCNCRSTRCASVTDVHPFGACIHNYQKVHSHKWACIINMQPTPGLLWIFPVEPLGVL